MQTGYNYMKGRYQLPNCGRFNRPDPMRDWDWENPASINLYQYVRNSPIEGWDPDGTFYIFEESGDKELDEKRKAAFEAARQADLKRGGEAAEAAEAFGEPGEDNGVVVKFGKLSNESHGAEAQQKIVFDAEGVLTYRAVVTFDPDIGGIIFEANVGHEGSHLLDGQKFFQSYDSEKITTDQSLNLTHKDTENKAFHITHDILRKSSSPQKFPIGGGDFVILGDNARGQRLENRILKILNGPVYREKLDKKLFEDIDF